MSQPAAVQVDDALSELVNQFADPFAFLRELVQNSLDAGSEEVEVAVEFEAGEDGASGVAVIRVDDWGDGMDREIIDKKLTRLFSSGKDGDMTKIGKFGIGFVSVFAIEPEAVCVDTSRDGENWRVLFDEKRAFRLLRLDAPVDGTKVKVFKTLAASEFPAFAARAEATLRYWCKHTRGDVRFSGKPIGEPFEVPDAPCSASADDGFSNIVVGHPRGTEAFFGFYNSGLTLIEGREHELAPLAFKASSPHLEHTLTRDNVIEDEGHARVLGALRTLCDGPLRSAVFAGLEGDMKLAAPSELRGYYYRAATWHVTRDRDAAAHEAARVVAKAPSGRLIPLDELSVAGDRGVVFFSGPRSPLSDAAEHAGYTVVEARSGGAAERFARAVRPPHAEVRELRKTFAHAVEVDPAVETDGSWKVLTDAVTELMHTQGIRVSAVSLGSFDYPSSPISDRVAITQRELGELTPLSEAALVTRGLFAVRRFVVVNVAHPLAKSAAALASSEPALAAYLLCKAFMLGGDLEPELDGALAKAAATMRARS